MTTTQSNYLQYLSTASLISSKHGLPDTNLKQVENLVSKSEFLVPIIGGFSAGKSTLINRLLERDVLPVDISPETELASEIRYSDQENIEAIRKDGTIVNFPLNEFSEIKKNRSEYTHLRVNITSDVLKAIHPIVLVDMPGFGSAIGAHAEALAYYMSKGAHYIAAISADEGAIPASMLAELSEIDSLGRSVSYMVTKCNLKSDQDIAEVSAHIATNIQIEMQQAITVHQCGLEARGLLGLIEKISKEAIAHELFFGHVEDAHVRTLEGLQIRSASIGKTLLERKEALDALEKTVQLLERQKTRKLEEIDGASSDLITRLCVKRVSSELDDALPDLVTKIKSKNISSFEEQVIAIVRSSIIGELRKHITQYSSDIIDDIGKELAVIDYHLADFDTENWIEGIVAVLKTQISKFESQIDELRTTLGKPGRNKAYKAVTTVLAVCTSVVVPAIEVAIIFLPEIISFFAQSKIDEKIESGVKNEVIPKIRAKLNEVIPSVVEDQMRNIVESTTQEFEKRIEEKKSVLNLISDSEKSDQENRTTLESIKKDVIFLRASALEYIYGEAA